MLLALASLALGEAISKDEWFTYIPIWCAVGVLVLEGIWYMYQQNKNKENLKRNTEKLTERIKEQ